MMPLLDATPCAADFRYATFRFFADYMLSAASVSLRCHTIAIAACFLFFAAMLSMPRFLPLSPPL